MRERTVEKYFNQKVKEHGGVTKKLTSQVGDVDRIVLWPRRQIKQSVEGGGYCMAQMSARVHFVELKTIDGVLSEAQKYEHKQLRLMGFRVSVIWTKEQVDLYIEENTHE